MNTAQISWIYCMLMILQRALILYWICKNILILLPHIVKNDLSVNIDKTRILVFRPLRSYEKWNLNGQQIEVVSFLKCLDICYQNLSSTVRKAIFLLNWFPKTHSFLPPNNICHIFGEMVVPILLYGIGIWERLIYIRLTLCVFVLYRYLSPRKSNFTCSCFSLMRSSTAIPTLKCGVVPSEDFMYA